MSMRVAKPQKTFDDQLERLVSHLKTQKLSLPGIELKVLEADVKAQREEKQADMELLARYEAAHQRFIVAQAERYARYMKVVKILRATHSDDPVKLRSLDQFKRPRGKKNAEPLPSPAPVAPKPAPLPGPGLAPRPAGKTKGKGRG